MVGAIFLILIIFIAFGVFATMFSSFVSYTQQSDQKQSQLSQNAQTSLSSSALFGSSIIPSGPSNPPAFLVNSAHTESPAASVVQYAMAFCTVTSCPVSFSSSVASGDIIVASIGVDSGGAPNGAADTLTDSYTLATSSSAACGKNTCYTYIWYTTASRSGSDTVTFTLSPPNPVSATLCIYEIKNASTSGILTSTGTGSSNTPAVLSFTPASNSVVIGIAAANIGGGGQPWTAGTGYLIPGTCSLSGACGEFQVGISSSTTVPMSFGGGLQPWLAAAISLGSIASNPSPPESVVQVALATCVSTLCPISFSSSVSSGDLIVASIGIDAGSAATGISDSLGNLFSSATSTSQACGHQHCYSYIWTATAQSSGADTVTITLGGKPTGATLGIYEITNGALSGLQTSTGTGNSNNPVVTTLTPTSSSIVVGIAAANLGGGGAAWTQGTDYVLPGSCAATTACGEFELGVSSATTVPITFGGGPQPWTEAAIAIGPTAVTTTYPFQGRLFYSQGLFWMFYSSGSAIVYQTSVNGIGWNASSTLTNAYGSGQSSGFSGYVGANTLYYVLAEYGGSSTITVASVPLNPSGTVGATTSATFSLASGYVTRAYDSIAQDTSGNIWAAVTVYSGTASYVQVIRCSSAPSGCTAMDGTNPPSITLATPNADDIVPMILSMSGGSMAVVYADSGGSSGTFGANAFNIETCTGGTATSPNVQCQATTGTPTWSSRVSSVSTFYPEYSDAVSIGTSVYFVGPTSSNIATWSCTFSTSAPPCGGVSPSTYAISSASSGPNAEAAVSENGQGNSLGAGNKLQVYFGSGTTLYNVSSASDTSWPASPQTVSTAETSLAGLNGIQNSTQSAAFWRSDLAPPFAVRFALANTNPYDPTLISPTTVGVSSTPTATSNTQESKLFYDLGLWWDFFATGSGISYATSADGLEWSSAKALITSATYSGAATGSDFTLDLSGNTVYWALSSGDSAATFDYNSGTLSSSGNITFGTVATVPTVYTSYGPISISVDQGGNEWVSLTTLESGPIYHIEVYEHSSGSANTAWSSNLAPSTLPILTATANSIIEGNQTATGAVLLAETSGATGTGSLSIYYATGSSGWTSSTWNYEATTIYDYALSSSSEELVGNVLCFAGLGSTSAGATTGTLNFWTYVFGVGSTSTSEAGSATQIETSAAAWQAALGVYQNTLFLFDSNGYVLNYYYSGNLGQTWSTKAIATPYETSISGLSAANGGTLAATWTAEGSLSGYSVRVGSLSSLSVTVNSANAVHIVGAYIANPNTNTLLSYYYYNSSELLDYWINPGSTVAVALSFTWATNTMYSFTIVTSTGVVVSESFTSPS